RKNSQNAGRAQDKAVGTKLIILKKVIFKKFSNLPPAPAPVRPESQGPEHGSQMLASARRRWPGTCRGHIAGAKDKVSAVGNRCATLHGKPECSSGLPLLVLK
ncbi:unnamed protein product, partial [Staurois parvus]